MLSSDATSEIVSWLAAAAQLIANLLESLLEKALDFWIDLLSKKSPDVIPKDSVGLGENFQSVFSHILIRTVGFLEEDGKVLFSNRVDTVFSDVLTNHVKALGNGFKVLGSDTLCHDNLEALLWLVYLVAKFSELSCLLSHYLDIVTSLVTECAQEYHNLELSHLVLVFYQESQELLVEVEECAGKLCVA